MSFSLEFIDVLRLTQDHVMPALLVGINDVRVLGLLERVLLRAPTETIGERLATGECHKPRGQLGAWILPAAIDHSDLVGNLRKLTLSRPTIEDIEPVGIVLNDSLDRRPPGVEDLLLIGFADRQIQGIAQPINLGPDLPHDLVNGLVDYLLGAIADLSGSLCRPGSRPHFVAARLILVSVTTTLLMPVGLDLLDDQDQVAIGVVMLRQPHPHQDVGPLSERMVIGVVRPDVALSPTKLLNLDAAVHEVRRLSDLHDLLPELQRHFVEVDDLIAYAAPVVGVILQVSLKLPLWAVQHRDDFIEHIFLALRRNDMAGGSRFHGPPWIRVRQTENHLAVIEPARQRVLSELRCAGDRPTLALVLLLDAIRANRIPGRAEILAIDRIENRDLLFGVIVHDNDVPPLTIKDDSEVQVQLVNAGVKYLGVAALQVLPLDTVLIGNPVYVQRIRRLEIESNLPFVKRGRSLGKDVLLDHDSVLVNEVDDLVPGDVALCADPVLDLDPIQLLLLHARLLLEHGYHLLCRALVLGHRFGGLKQTGGDPNQVLVEGSPAASGQLTLADKALPPHTLGRRQVEVVQHPDVCF